MTPKETNRGRLFKFDSVEELEVRINQYFSYPADHPLAAEFAEQTARLLREYKGDGEYLSVHHPAEPDARDDSPDATALALFGAAGGVIGEVVFV